MVIIDFAVLVAASNSKKCLNKIFTQIIKYISLNIELGIVLFFVLQNIHYYCRESKIQSVAFACENVERLFGSFPDLIKPFFSIYHIIFLKLSKGWRRQVLLAVLVQNYLFQNWFLVRACTAE